MLCAVNFRSYISGACDNTSIEQPAPWLAGPCPTTPRHVCCLQCPSPFASPCPAASAVTASSPCAHASQASALIALRCTQNIQMRTLRATPAGSTSHATPHLRSQAEEAVQRSEHHVWRNFEYENTKRMIQSTTTKKKDRYMRFDNDTIPLARLPNTAMLKLPTRRPRLPDCVDNKPAKQVLR